MELTFVKKTIISFFILFLGFYFWEIYFPFSFNGSPKEIIYEVKKGSGAGEIAADLQKSEIIKNRQFFVLHAFVSGDFRKLQAGKYKLSSSISISEIVKKIARGEAEKNRITIIEGWNINDIGEYLDKNGYYQKEDFLNSAEKNWNDEFSFLKNGSNKLKVEGYLFPDTYEVSQKSAPDDLIKKALANFDKKLTQEMKKEIFLRGKSVFEIIIMASMIEKEVRFMEDKKIVSGILWKRLESGMPLQVDATINYITGKKNSRAEISDTKIDSPYNTYGHRGLPAGPISNPGIESILAAIYPVETDYWYYLSANGTGETIFSKTLDEHNQSAARYLSFRFERDNLS